jgi:hypothetical protein
VAALRPRSSTVSSVAAALLVLLSALSLTGCGRLEGRDGRSWAVVDTIAPATRTDSSFAGLVAELSEPGGYFDTDNLISNEASYLHVIGKLREMGVRGGAYIGVGPDQNFSYIAHLQPRVAFIVDLRRDNLLQQLFFKALFELSASRIEYLCLLFGRPAPASLAAWQGRELKDLLAYVDSTPAREEIFARATPLVSARLRGFGVPLSARDLATITRIRRSFFDGGLDLRFTTFNRPPRPGYPSYRQLLLERDRSGTLASYLAREEDYRFVRELQRSDLLIPVVGDLAGDHALRAIGDMVARRGERVSAFYTSNVEFYLMRQGRLHAFAENARHLPRDERSVIIRSVFNYAHPASVPGYLSTQLLQQLEGFLDAEQRGEYRSYAELVDAGR